VHTGPALGAFNQWARSSDLGGWRSRHVEHIAEAMMEGAAERLRRFACLSGD
jgi:trans-AT polyketide synthase/acyltransferase/oxidoreductase domain-containing protein